MNKAKIKENVNSECNLGFMECEWWFCDHNCLDRQSLFGEGDMGLDPRKPVFVGCKQQRCGPACASAQSDQCLYYLLTEKYYIYTCLKRNFNILASICSRGDWFESRFVRHPEDRFCRVNAQIFKFTVSLLI